MTATESDSPYRLLILGDGSVRTVTLRGDRWVIGRSKECTIPLRDPTVSRRHILLERVGEEFRFQDLGGANPAMLDGRPVRQGVLALGQPLTLGLTRLVVEERRRPRAIETDSRATIVLSREVIDDDADVARRGPTALAGRLLERLEWAFADLGDLADTAEPLLELALNLTDHGAGWIVRFHSHGATETLAALRLDASEFVPHLAEGALQDARRIGQPHLLTTREGTVEKQRLLIPLGTTETGGLLVLEEPREHASNGQELLGLAQSLGAVIWQRLLETIERQRLRDELSRLRFRGTLAHNALLSSTRLQATRELLRAVAGGHDALLLVGEPGTEREDLARYLHAESPRQHEPVCCWDAQRAAKARHEADIFGDAQQEGLLYRTGAGTLFVDNMHLIAPQLQQRLLDHVSQLPADSRPRIVAAVDEPGLKRIDPRLTVDPIRIPPLRDDARDVLTLAELFLSELGPCPDGSPRLMTERTKRALVQYAWPGNVRELLLTIEAAAARAGNQPIAPRHLPETILADETAGPNSPMQTLEEVERDHIQEVMHRVGGVRARAAQVLGIASSTLYEKLKKYRIDA